MLKSVVTNLTYTKTSEILNLNLFQMLYVLILQYFFTELPELHNFFTMIIAKLNMRRWPLVD